MNHARLAPKEDAMASKKRETSQTFASWCPECGPGVALDEDGLCAGCGVTCQGPGATQAWEEQARAEAAEARVRELEAQCAAMREALESLWAAVGDRLLAKGPLSREYANSVQSGIKAALSSSAGRALLERVEALERVADAARVVKKHGYCGDDASNLDASVDVLDALKEKR